MREADIDIEKLLVTRPYSCVTSRSEAETINEYRCKNAFLLINKLELLQSLNNRSVRLTLNRTAINPEQLGYKTPTWLALDLTSQEQDTDPSDCSGSLVVNVDHGNDDDSSDDDLVVGNAVTPKKTSMITTSYAPNRVASFHNRTLLRGKWWKDTGLIAMPPWLLQT